MKRELTAKIITTMQRRMTHWRFLIESQFDKKDILACLSLPEFYQVMLIHIERDDYSCKALEEAFKSVSHCLFDTDIDETFLEKVYYYALSLSFPDAVIIELESDRRVYAFFLKLLHVYNEFQMNSDDGSFMSVYPLEMLSHDEVLELEDADEYKRFEEAFKVQNIYEMMKLNYEVAGHSTIEHILGVHHLAMTIARQLNALKIPIDLGRISGAAAGHDIGKFGCRPEEKNKIAYYHYYYTDEWFTKLNINYIKNVAVYHSTWDLELESLSLESLILIYSDFCVKRSKNKQSLFKMKFLSVDESFEVILDKLDNVDEKKKVRYERVYKKLKNFSEYLEDLGVHITVENYTGMPLKEILTFVPTIEHFSALQQGMDVVDHLKHMAIEKSVALMHRLRHVNSLNEIIQEAKNEKDIQMFRRYLFIFEEYSTYLTPEQKMITIDFLLDYIIHSEEDVRKESSYLIGKLIGDYDENYTKELPERAKISYTVETKFNKINALIHQFIYHDIRMTPVKRMRQVSSYYYVLEALYERADDEFKEVLTEMLLSYYEEPTDEYGVMFLLEIMPMLSSENFGIEKLSHLVNFIVSHLEQTDEIKMMAFAQLKNLLKDPLSDETSNLIKSLNLIHLTQSEDLVEIYLLEPLLTLYGINNTILIEANKSEMFLSNLKSATPKTIKIAQIEMLYNHSINKDNEERFYTAMHFCNILKVSAYESVRNKAGHYLVLLFERLSSEQKNDIVIELIRALEIEGYGFTRYIPNFLGQLIPTLEVKEYHEILNDINYKISNAGINVRVLLLNTIGAMIAKWLQLGRENSLDALLGCVFKGFYSGNKLTAQMAFNVISKDIIGNGELPLESRFSIFSKLYKKLHVFLMDNHRYASLDLFNYTVGLHYIYHFITDYSFYRGEMIFKRAEKVAFYSGTFDPFSLGQKSAAVDAKNQDFEVFIGISEFQWRRRTQPSLMRREIIEMSISDQMSIHTFPQRIPINLRRYEDHQKLRHIFVNQEVYLIIGEEALVNDTLYEDESNPIYEFPHIIYKRESIKHSVTVKELIKERVSYMKSDVIIRPLEYKYEMIDVAQIRRNIDNNWDAYDVIDDLATHFIKSHSLYKNEPEFKSIVSLNDLSIEVLPLKKVDDLESLCLKFDVDFERINHLRDGTYAGDLDKSLILERHILLIRDESINEIIAFSVYSKASPKHLFDEIKSLDILKDIADKKREKIIILDEIVMKPYPKVHALDQIILTETLMNVIKEGYDYAVIKCHHQNDISKDIRGVLIRSGFEEHACTYTNKLLYAVDMATPVVINLDGTTRMKAAYRQHDDIRETIKLVRTNLQQAVVSLYPGSLVLSFDRSMLYNHLIRMITSTNGVTIYEGDEKGPFMCVPYGDIFKRWLLPNTVTKSFHTERYYNEAVEHYEVKAYPGYLSIEEQSKALKAFDRPLILIDDIVDKGNRLKAIDRYLKSEEIPVNQVIVGIMSERGRDLFEQQGMSLSAAYFIPKIKVWFNEADVYPFIGGDSLFRTSNTEKALLPSVNLMLPFVYPKYIKGVSKIDLYNLSLACLENAMHILSEIEKVYSEINNRSLSIEHLKEVMIIPRIPDVGEHMAYDINYKPTDFLKNELERLKKMKDAFKDTI